MFSLLRAIQQSIHELICKAHSNIFEEDEFKLLEFLELYPTQIGILGLQMIWTRSATVALEDVKYDSRCMQLTNKKFQSMLLLLIEHTTLALSPKDRTKYEAFITIHLHQKDVFEELVR